MKKFSRLFGPAVFGVIALLSSLSKPRVEALHATDILGLLGAGMCFGVALVGLFGWLRGRRPGDRA